MRAGRAGICACSAGSRRASTADQATVEANRLFDAFERETPKDYRQAGADVTPLGDLFLGPVRPVLLTLWAGVAALLLVACGNVAHLLMLRASERSEEIAVRTALGVSRTRLVRQFLTESILLALAGGAAGMAVAWAAVRLVAAEGPDQIPRLAQAAMTVDVVLVGVALTLASGVIFGLLPLRQVLRHAAGGLRRSGVRVAPTPRRRGDRAPRSSRRTSPSRSCCSSDPVCSSGVSVDCWPSRRAWTRPAC